MVSRQYRVTRDEQGNLALTDASTGELCDWISAPAETSGPGDTSEYVVIAERPDTWPQDIRWMVTTGTKVRQTSGIKAGRIGEIAGQARSQKANRIFRDNLKQAEQAGRELADADFEILIDSEGPLIRFPGQDELEWFPGQAFCFEPLPMDTQDVVSRITDLAAIAGGPEGLQLIISTPSGEYRVTEVVYEEDLAGTMIIRTSQFPITKGR